MREVAATGELAGELARLVTNRLLDPLEIVLGDSEAVAGLRARVAAQAGIWAADMTGPDDTLAGRTAFRLICALYPGDEPFSPPPRWWQTPLGQVVARRVGVPGVDGVPVAVAAAMLGVSRQFVHDLVKRGKLARRPDGTVSVSSIRDRMRARSTGDD